MVAEDVNLTHHYHYDEDGNLRCKDHPLKTNNQGGICALCLQDKLTKLVSSPSSSSFPLPVFPSSSSSSSPSPPSFRSNASTAAPSLRPQSTQKTHDRSLLNPARNPFSLSLKNKSKEKKNVNNKSSSSSGEAVLKRSKSINYFGESNDNDVDNPRRRKGFWSFLVKKSDKPRNVLDLGQNGSSLQQGKKETSYVVVEENDSPDGISLDRRVSRSRSVGCGSRSFSGDLFERISTGLVTVR